MVNTSNHTLVSIIIPIYNVDEFLDETIQSVLNQSFQEFELILINDGSTDRSALICQEYLSKDKRIQFINQENSGVSIARNNGLLLAKGKYVFFMDSDDTLDSDFIKSSFEAAEKDSNNITIVGEEYCKRLPNVTALPTCAQFLKRSFLVDHPEIRFPEHIQPCEDGLFSHQLLALTTAIGANLQGNYHYRKHSSQNHVKINENSWKVLHQIPSWFSILSKFYEKNDLFYSHSFHLALFVEHEPFEIRYLRLTLDEEQKKYLFDLIKEFMSKYVDPYLSNENRDLLSKPFLYFLRAESYSDFDNFYKRYLKQRAAKRKILLFLVKLIPFSNLRRGWRENIRAKY
ncbi:glycosyltransferase family 2 protein [Sphingobacterium spiritivorum]